MNKVYTIGYEGKSREEFLDILEDKSINHVADVRSVPRSQRNEFSKKNLKDFLFHHGIMYVHLPELGGMRDEDYREVMKEEEWEEAFQELRELAQEGRTAMMCLEKDPMRCHRRFIAERYEEKDWEVVHLGKGGSWSGKTLEDFGSEEEG